MEKTLSNNVVRFKSKYYQILVASDGPSLRKKSDVIEEPTNGNIKFRYAGKYYNNLIISKKGIKTIQLPKLVLIGSSKNCAKKKRNHLINTFITVIY